MFFNDYILPFLYAYIACLAFSFIFGLRGKFIFLAPLGGSICWTLYLALNFTQNDLIQSFLATMAVAIYSEILARIYKAPATMFLIISILPLVPGAGIYYTMEYCVAGDQMSFYTSLVHTLAIAGALSLGIVLVSSFFRLFFQLWQRIRYHDQNACLHK
ncbi:threonine/serine exporter family protein [Acidaminobacterium chupaoyuni]